MSEESKVPYKDGEGYCSFNFINKPALIFGIPFGIFMGSAFVLVITVLGLMFTVGWIAAVIAATFILAPLMYIKLLCEKDANSLKFIKYRLQGYFHKRKYKGEFYYSSVNDIGADKDDNQTQKTLEREKIGQ